MKTLNGSDLAGNKIRVKKAAPKKPDTGDEKSENLQDLFGTPFEIASASIR